MVHKLVCTAKDADAIKAVGDKLTQNHNTIRGFRGKGSICQGLTRNCFYLLYAEAKVMEAIGYLGKCSDIIGKGCNK